MDNRNLLGLDQQFDQVLLDFAFLAKYHREIHPANAGDVSTLLDEPTARKAIDRFGDSASNWFPISRLDLLASIRADGRAGYRSQGIRDPQFFNCIRVLSGRLLLITRTGSQIPAIHNSIVRGKDGELLTLIQVNDRADSIRVVYGNAQYGSIPSIETHIHLVGNALMLAEGSHSAAVVHAHPPHLVLLGRHPRVHGNFELFNAALYTQVEGILRNYSGLVGTIEYIESGTEELVRHTIDPFMKHRLLLWMNHGFVVREASIRRAYTMIAYAEDAARAALQTFATGAAGLPIDVVRPFLAEKALINAYTELFEATSAVETNHIR